MPTLIKAVRIAASETGGVGTEADARKRLMVVPKCHVLDKIAAQHHGIPVAIGRYVADVTTTGYLAARCRRAPGKRTQKLLLS